MRFLNEEEVHLRLSSEKNLANRFGKVTTHENGEVITKALRIGGNTNHGDISRNLTMLLPDSRKDIAKALDMSTRTVGHIKTGDIKAQVYEQVEAAREETKAAIQDSAIQKTLLALNLISEDKLSSLGAKDLANTAKNLSAIVINTGEKKEEKNRTTLIVYAPRVKELDEFTSIEVEGC